MSKPTGPFEINVTPATDLLETVASRAPTGMQRSTADPFPSAGGSRIPCYGLPSADFCACLLLGLARAGAENRKDQVYDQKTGTSEDSCPTAQRALVCAG
jgi:hypothetical protein